MENHIVKEIASNSEHKRFWRVQIPSFGEPNFYHQVTSFSWFFHGRNKRNYKRDGTLYYACREEEFLEQQKSFAKVGIVINPEIIDIPSLWEFYKVIGYDYKKKEYR